MPEINQQWEEVTGGLCETEQDLRKVMIHWQEHEELVTAGQVFIGHIQHIAGEEVLEGSGGDDQLLPRFLVCKLHPLPPTASSPSSLIHSTTWLEIMSANMIYEIRKPLDMHIFLE